MAHPAREVHETQTLLPPPSLPDSDATDPAVVAVRFVLADTAGGVLGVSSNVDGDRAVVTVAVRRSVRVSGQADGRLRIGFHTVTLVWDYESGRWLVVDYALS